MKRFNKLKAIWILILPSIFGSVHAQNSISLEKALAITIKENIDIKIKTTELDQVKNYEKVGVLGVLPIIKVNGAASGNTGSSSIEFATEDFPEINDADSESKSIIGNVEISYSLFGGLASVYTYQKLKKQSDLKSTELLMKIEQVLLNTAKQYYDIAYLQEENKILYELLEVSKERYSRVKIQNEFGNASKLDLLAAEIDLNKDSVTVMNSDYQLKAAKERLNQTLNRDLSTDYAVESYVEINKDLNYSELLELTNQNNSNILFHQYLIEITRKDKKINNTSIFPSVSVSAQYGYNQNESNTSIILDQSNTGLTGFVNLSWDIFDAMARKRIAQNTQIEIESNELKLESIKKEIQKEFNVTYQQYENNIKLIEIETRNNEASERFFQRAKNQFFQGQLSRSDFRLAQVDLSISKNRLNQSLFMAKIAELNLYRLSGKIINETVK
jgi:outer membrane protein TolC|tara:strand:- start:369 stop:1703 length:1335 start_codon:yes stop_codon:yes gene_type:complete